MDSDLPKLTPEQFRQLMEEVRAAKPTEGKLETYLHEVQRKIKKMEQERAARKGSEDESTGR
jgi:predicted  nucleic acid-binding Zn-ribbon protein